MISSGGKTGRAPRTWKVFQACEAFLKESLAPFADDLSWERNLSGDLVVVEPPGGHQDDFGSHDLTIR